MLNEEMSLHRCQWSVMFVLSIVFFTELDYIFIIGLCRTCEIFGVSELVISNSKILEDKQFKNLSVTSEKWVTVTEVN